MRIWRFLVMKIKKFISILLSALMISSVFAGITVSAKEIIPKEYEKTNGAKMPTETVVGETKNDKGETGDVTYKGGIYDGPD